MHCSVVFNGVSVLRNLCDIRAQFTMKGPWTYIAYNSATTWIVERQAIACVQHAVSCSQRQLDLCSSNGLRYCLRYYILAMLDTKVHTCAG